MLTVEYRVNGQLIGFTNITNKCTMDKDNHMFPFPPNIIHTCTYEFSHKPVEMKGTRSGLVKHNRADGFEKLVLKVLKKITK